MKIVSQFCFNVNNIQTNQLDLESTPVRGTSYQEVHELIGTSGCSREEPYWTWEVMGVIETPNGRLVVNPGDWVVEIITKRYVVIPDKEYKKFIWDNNL